MKLSFPFHIYFRQNKLFSNGSGSPGGKYIYVNKWTIFLYLFAKNKFVC